MRLSTMSNHRTRRSGLTMVEILVVLAIIGVLIGLLGPLVRQPGARLYAGDVRSQIQQARYEAIKRNVPVAVVFNAVEQRFETRFDTAATVIGDACGSTTTSRLKPASDYQNIAVSPNNFGIVWLPSGIGQPCTAPFDNMGPITVTDGRTTRVVTATTAGSVILE